ncbi:trypsin-like peptidase domain-containing protein [Caldifermentibacillus hisashii]|uniref:S1C family serine protease n=1 Tax=Caldifermentibacillus hisashii TaxID=996558 RepID=UPI003100FC46
MEDFTNKNHDESFDKPKETDQNEMNKTIIQPDGNDLQTIEEQAKSQGTVHHSSKNTSSNPNNDLNEDKHKKKRKPIAKTIGSNLLVGIISSVLTVALVSYFGFPANGNDDGNTKSDAKVVQPVSKDAVYTSTFTKADQATIADIVEELSPTIVGVINLQKMQSQFNLQSDSVPTGSGSGVIFKKDNKYGYIITNNHVIEGANEIQVSLYSGEKVKAEVVGADALTDLAVLKIDGKYVNEVASFGDSSQLRTGDEVIAIGNPLGEEFSRTVTQGIVSATDRSISVNTSAGEWEITAIQTDAAINPGNSGGALINANGEVIGINSLKIAEDGVEGLGFAIPSNDVIPIAEELINKGEIKRPYLGIQMYDVANIVQFYRQSMFGNLENGIVVAAVEPGSPAAKAGLKVNDVIVGIDGNEIKNVTELRKYLYSKVTPGNSVKIDFYRDGKKQTVTVETTSS